jgi:hypothetical protein
MSNATAVTDAHFEADEVHFWLTREKEILIFASVQDDGFCDLSISLSDFVKDAPLASGFAVDVGTHFTRNVSRETVAKAKHFFRNL